MALTANVIFSNFRAYGIKKFDVYVGQSFRVNLEGSTGSIKDWYSNKDQILEIKVSDDKKSADIKALTVGKVDLQVQSSGNRVDIAFDIEVFDDIPIGLGLTAGTPVLK